MNVTVTDDEAPVITCIGEPGGATIAEDFDAGLPAGWSTVINTGTCDWLNIADLPIGPDFATPGMVFDDDDCGSGADPSNATLLSDVYDLSGSTTATLGYDVAFFEIGAGDYFLVEVWDGAAWQQVANYVADIDPILTESIDVAAYANANFQVRWTYDDGGAWAWHGGIDNFSLVYDVPGGNDVTLTVTDVNGNVSTCIAVVTVEDVTPPVAVCMDITVQLDPTGTVTILGSDVAGASTDACGIASYDLDIDTFDCSNVGPNTVTVTITDVNGNVSTCTAVVTVEDVTAPDLVCMDITLELGADGTATITPADVIDTLADACGILTSAVDIEDFSCDDIGTPVTVTVFVVDASGNTCGLYGSGHGGGSIGTGTYVPSRSNG